MIQTKFQLGDSVVVKANVKDPELNVNMGGWQGRISEISKKGDSICVDWDSLTLRQIPVESIEQCEEDGLDWARMYLHPKDVEQTNSRDSEDDVDDVMEYLECKYAWSHLGEQGKRIQAVLSKVDDESELATFEAWEEYFEQTLEFPFDAKVAEWQERGPLRTGERIKVLGIEETDESYGILVSLLRKHQKYIFPLCDLEVVDKTSSNYQPVKDYVVWFANR